MKEISTFLSRLEKHALIKYKLYDGFGNASNRGIDSWMRLLAEEVGEIASAITRDRHILAREECIDVAHVAMLMYIALEQKIKEAEGQNERD